MAYVRRFFKEHPRFNTPCDLCKKPILEAFIVPSGRHRKNYKVHEAFHFDCYHKLLALRHPPRPKPPQLIDQSEKEKWLVYFQREEQRIDKMDLREVS